ncbi:MAG: DUF72 domain-containing protein, partial [Gemmatimonadaceae bacterium]
RQWWAAFPEDGSHLARYATMFSGAEINSSFYRHHRRATYERWAAAVPDVFRFAVKLPRTITHDQSLVAAEIPLEVFLEEVRGLGKRLGPLLVQLPPSLPFVEEHAEAFFALLRSMHGGGVACEPRHASWFAADADAFLTAHGVARVAADPARVPEAAAPGGAREITYYRLHGSPRMYYSDYAEGFLGMMAHALARDAAHASQCWCIFDNTTLGAATGNALVLARMLGLQTASTA